MRILPRMSVVPFVASAFVAISAPAFAVVITTLDFPGALSSFCSGIDGETIVGTYTDSSNAQHGYVYDGASFTTIDVPASFGSNTNARGVSVGGSEIAGFYTDAASVFHGFVLYDHTLYQSMDDPSAGTSAGQGTRAFGIDNGRIVGDFLPSSGPEQGYLFDGSMYTTIAPGPTVQSAAFGIEGIKIVGVEVDTYLRGMVFDGSMYTTLDDPLEGTTVAPQGTELFGVQGNRIVGTYFDSSTVQHGFYYDGSAFTTIDYPGSRATSLLGIDADRLVGRYTDTSGVMHGLIVYIGPTGDYNQNGTVDAADYVLWRHTLGQSGPELLADGDGNHTVDSNDYNVWRQHFGQSGAELSTATQLPEPPTWILFLIPAVACSIRFFANRPTRSS